MHCRNKVLCSFEETKITIDSVQQLFISQIQILNEELLQFLHVDFLRICMFSQHMEYEQSQKMGMFCATKKISRVSESKKSNRLIFIFSDHSAVEIKNKIPHPPHQKNTQTYRTNKNVNPKQKHLPSLGVGKRPTFKQLRQSAEATQFRS